MNDDIIAFSFIIKIPLKETEWQRWVRFLHLQVDSLSIRTGVLVRMCAYAKPNRHVLLNTEHKIVDTILSVKKADVRVYCYIIFVRHKTRKKTVKYGSYVD